MSHCGRMKTNIISDVLRSLARGVGLIGDAGSGQRIVRDGPDAVDVARALSAGRRLRRRAKEMRLGLSHADISVRKGRSSIAVAAVVVDCAFILAWALDEEKGDALVDVLELVSRHGGEVPRIWPAELANALLKLVRRKLLGADACAKCLPTSESIPSRLTERYTGLRGRGFCFWPNSTGCRRMTHVISNSPCAEAWPWRRRMCRWPGRLKNGSARFAPTACAGKIVT